MYGYLYLNLLYKFYAIKFLLYIKYEMLQNIIYDVVTFNKLINKNVVSSCTTYIHIYIAFYYS